VRSEHQRLHHFVADAPWSDQAVLDTVRSYGLCRSKRRVSCALAIRTTGRLMTTLKSAVARVLKRLHYPLDVILTCVRWYVAYPLSLRHLEEVMAERGISVDHSTVHRWAIKVLPVLEKAFRRRKRAVGRSWRMDETYIKVRGQWKYLYRAVDKEGNTVDFLIFCCVPIVTRPRRGATSKSQSTRTVNPRR